MAIKHYVCLGDVPYRLEIEDEKRMKVTYGAKVVKPGMYEDYETNIDKPYWRLHGGLSDGSIIEVRCARTAAKMVGR